MDTRLQHFQEQIGRNITAARDSRSMGLNELARRSGVDPGNLSKIEAGKMGCSVKTLMRLSESLDVPLFRLMMDEEDTDAMNAISRLIPVGTKSALGVAPAKKK